MTSDEDRLDLLDRQIAAASDVLLRLARALGHPLPPAVVAQLAAEIVEAITEDP